MIIHAEQKITLVSINKERETFYHSEMESHTDKISLKKLTVTFNTEKNIIRPINPDDESRNGIIWQLEAMRRLNEEGTKDHDPNEETGMSHSLQVI